MRLWCASLNPEVNNYILSKMCRILKYDDSYQFPLSKVQEMEILQRLDNEHPELYLTASRNPLGQGWIFSIDELRRRYEGI